MNTGLISFSPLQIVYPKEMCLLTVLDGQEADADSFRLCLFSIFLYGSLCLSHLRVLSEAVRVPLDPNQTILGSLGCQLPAVMLLPHHAYDRNRIQSVF